MNYYFSKQSIEAKDSCTIPLQLVANSAIKFWDCIVLEGYRGKEDQNKHFEAGTSKVKFPNSRHNKQPAEAIHLAPYNPNIPGGVDWDDIELFYQFGFFVLGIAYSRGIQLRWGGDWDMDGVTTDQSFHDLVHFEFHKFITS